MAQEIVSKACHEPIKLNHPIGEPSAYARVYAGICNGHTVAVKISNRQSLRREAKLLKDISDIQLSPRLLDYFVHDGYHVIIMDMMQITLSRYLLNDRVTPGTLEDFVSRLHLFHQRGFVHGDIHPNNIMFSNDRLYLIDLQPTHAGTPLTDLTELLDGLYSFPLDIAAEVYGYGSDMYKEVTTRVQNVDALLRRYILEYYNIVLPEVQQEQQQQQQQQQQ